MSNETLPPDTADLNAVSHIMPDLGAKRGLVTGASSGIGREIARLMASCGASVLAVDIDESGLDSLARECGDGLVPMQVDVTAEEEVAAAAHEAVTQFGGLDLAVNVAGAGRPGAILDMNVVDWDFVVALVQKGVFLSTKHEARAMVDAGGGSIVNISSLNAHVPMEMGSSYTSAKAGVEMFSRNAALELGTKGIRVNAVLPGLVDTPATAPVFASEPLLEDFLARIPLRRAAQPLDVAMPCMFLLSDAARYVTGTSLVVDGGWEITNYPSMSRYLSH